MLQMMAELCEKWHHCLLPYGVLLGWVFQTGPQVVIFEHVQENGRQTQYVMPQLELGESRKDQLSRICQEGHGLQDLFWRRRAMWVCLLRGTMTWLGHWGRGASVV